MKNYFLYHSEKSKFTNRNLVEAYINSISKNANPKFSYLVDDLIKQISDANLENRQLKNKIIVYNAKYGSSYGRLSILPILEIKFDYKNRFVSYTIKPNFFGLIMIFPFLLIAILGIYNGFKTTKIDQVICLSIFLIVIYTSIFKKFNFDVSIFKQIINQVKNLDKPIERTATEVSN